MAVSISVDHAEALSHQGTPNLLTSMLSQNAQLRQIKGVVDWHQPRQLIGHRVFVHQGNPDPKAEDRGRASSRHQGDAVLGPHELLVDPLCLARIKAFEVGKSAKNCLIGTDESSPPASDVIRRLDSSYHYPFIKLGNHHATIIPKGIAPRNRQDAI
jgi:hypothetical protein